MTYKYDVSLSFAGEDRIFVEKFARILEQNNIKVFYDKFEEVDLWGKDLGIHFDTVYRKSAKYFIPFISKSYKEKIWTNYELKNAIARAIENNSEYILPVRFDDTEIEGLRPTIKFISLKGKTPEDLAKLFLAKLKKKENKPISEQFQEKVKNIISIELYSSFYAGSFGVKSGTAVLKMRITNKLIGNYRYYYEPMLKITIPLNGSDTFQLLNIKSEYNFPIKLEYGEEITINYNLDEDQLEIWEKMAMDCEVFAICTTTIGEQFESNKKKVNELINIIKR